MMERRKSLSLYAQLLKCVQLFATPWTVAFQAPLSMKFFRQQYWSGLSFPPSGNLPNPGIESTSLLSPSLPLDSLPLHHVGSLISLKFH